MSYKEENLAVKRGDKFTITLESNPASGYIWVPTFSRSIINLISHRYLQSSGARIGRPGKELFTFIAMKTGSENLRMVYKRSWEKTSAAEKVFIINVK